MTGAELLAELHRLAEEIADHFGDEWPHSPACQGEPACPLCRILWLTAGGQLDEFDHELDDEEAAELVRRYAHRVDEHVIRVMAGWITPEQAREQAGL